MKLFYRYDAGHGWLQVPLGLMGYSSDVSDFSYHDSTFAYLEEDCDMQSFLKCLNDHGIYPDIRDIDDGDNSDIRMCSRITKRWYAKLMDGIAEDSQSQYDT